MTLTTIKPVAGRTLVCPAGSRTLAGLPLASGARMPDEGAIVPREVWAIRVVGRGDAEVVEAVTEWPRPETAASKPLKAATSPVSPTVAAGSAS